LSVPFAKLARYAGVSAFTTTVSLGLLAALLAVLPAVWANLTAVGVGSIVSLELNRRWVWRHGGRLTLQRHVLPFVAASLLFLALSTLAVGAVGGAVHHSAQGSAFRTLLIEATTLATFAIRWGAQYVVMDRFFFASRPGET
jgi:putative flippase GtrA